MERSERNEVGGNTAGVTPVPIPNTEVKPSKADDTAAVRQWESRTLPGYNKGPLVERSAGLFFFTERMRRQTGHPLCSRNARSKTPLVGRPHYGDQPGYPRREGEKEKARIKKFAAGLVGCFGWRAAIRDSAEVQLASNEWPGLSMSMTSGA